MIDAFVIFTKGGLVLWKYELSPLEGDPIAHLLQDILVTERQGLTSYNYKSYQLKWQFANELDLIFVAIVLKIAKNTGIDDILLSTKDTFINNYKIELKKREYQFPYGDFEKYFHKIVDHVEKLTITTTKKPLQSPQSPQSPHSPSSLTITPQYKPSVQTTKVTPPESPCNSDVLSSDFEDPGRTLSQDKHENSSDEKQDKDNNGNDSDNIIDDIELQRQLRIQARLEQRKQNQDKAKQQQQQQAAITKAGKSGKSQTKWIDSKVTKEEMSGLDMSEVQDKNVAESQKDTSLANNYGIPQRDLESTINSHGAAPTIGESYWDVTQEQGKDLDIKIKLAEEEANQGKGVWGYFQGLVGQKELTKEDLNPVLQQFTERLMNKNVAPDIAKQLVESVISGLVGKKLGTFNTMYATVKSSLEESLTRLLTPKKPIDVMTGVAQAKALGRPYSIVFCGVNGVGKSTSLSKIASFFLAQGLTVGVAACDTFRSGAIEQLKTHCAALKIPLYDKGYGRDEATVAQDGIMNAKKDGLDVILIDTAGRMQGNDPLMKGLARLMTLNNPDLILFVGEALVGNDGCDQLINFNRALRENSVKQHPRLIDGIVLTKFDTIDDKVGTAINMTYSTGQPIVFVGVGQRYRDLKRPNPRLFIDALFA